MLLEYNHRRVHRIDGIPTILVSVKGSLAKAMVVRDDLTLDPCFVAKSDGFFAHGKTAAKAVAAVRVKAMESMPLEERIRRFVAAYPTLQSSAKNADLFDWHGTLTGSCAFGRTKFAKENEIDLSASSTVAEFIEKTKNQYGGNAIAELRKAYGK